MEKLRITANAVRCPSRRDLVDIERCLACCAFSRIDGTRRSGRYVRCSSERSRRTAGRTNPLAPSIADLVAIP